MKKHNLKLKIIILLGTIFLAVSSVYAETAEEYFKQGFVSYGQGNFTQAISDYTKAIGINAFYIKAYNNREMAYYKLKEYNKAWADVHAVEAIGGTVGPYFIEDLKKASGKGR